MSWGAEESLTLEHLVCGGGQFQLLVHVPVGQAHGAVQVEELGAGAELQGHAGMWGRAAAAGLTSRNHS